jgi:hypothetical protein
MRPSRKKLWTVTGLGVEEGALTQTRTVSGVGTFQQNVPTVM